MPCKILETRASLSILLLLIAVNAGCLSIEHGPGTPKTNTQTLTETFLPESNQLSFIGYAPSGQLEHAYTAARDDALETRIEAHQIGADSIQRIFGVWDPASGTMRLTMLLIPQNDAAPRSPNETLQQQLADQVAEHAVMNQVIEIQLLELCPTDKAAKRFTGQAATLDIQTAFENAVVRALPARHGSRNPLHFVVCSIGATDGPVEGAPDAVVTIEVENP